MKSVNCRWNDLYQYCFNPEIKHSWWGLGERMCIEFIDHNKRCRLKEPNPKPPPPPSPKGSSSQIKGALLTPPEKTPFYRLLSRSDKCKLEISVNEHIRNEFVPLDGPFFVKNRWYQAVIHKVR